MPVHGHASTQALRQRCLVALAGVGDPSAQWEEWTGRAYHIRRRLTPEEQSVTGPVLDIRGTPEAQHRFDAVARELPAPARRLAAVELAESPGQGATHAR